MTAQKIREIDLEYRDPENALSGNVLDCAFFLREIAAQLAEMNQQLAAIKISVRERS